MIMILQYLKFNNWFDLIYLLLCLGWRLVLFLFAYKVPYFKLFSRLHYVLNKTSSSKVLHGAKWQLSNFQYSGTICEGQAVKIQDKTTGNKECQLFCANSHESNTLVVWFNST